MSDEKRSRFYLVADKSYVIRYFDAGVDLYMIDFDAGDLRNAAKHITAREMITAERLRSKNVFFYKREPERESVKRRGR